MDPPRFANEDAAVRCHLPYSRPSTRIVPAAIAKNAADEND
jgi:hypothetical protein